MLNTSNKYIIHKDTLYNETKSEDFLCKWLSSDITLLQITYCMQKTLKHQVLIPFLQENILNKNKLNVPDQRQRDKNLIQIYNSIMCCLQRN